MECPLTNIEIVDSGFMHIIDLINEIMSVYIKFIIYWLENDRYYKIYCKSGRNFIFLVFTIAIMYAYVHCLNIN